ncbi:MAG TPA: hypothetical protein PK048_02510 [Candidatus Absconditabacterales bacterium]|nr:hypothetical protein [Candidatus Absconditabacterales bacterium]
MTSNYALYELLEQPISPGAKTYDNEIFDPKSDSLEQKLSDIETTLKDLHGKVGESLLAGYKNELNELKPKIDKNLSKIESGDKRKGLFKSREKYTQELHTKLHQLEFKVYGTAKQFGILSPAEKQREIERRMLGDQSVLVGSDGNIYTSSDKAPSGVHCSPKTINVEQVINDVKADPTKALTKHGLIPTGSAFLAKNTYIKPETAQIFLTIFALRGAWKTIGAIYDSKLGDKSMLRTAFIATFGGAMFWPMIKAVATGGYDKLEKKGMFGLQDVVNEIGGNTTNSIDQLSKQLDQGVDSATVLLSFFKDTNQLKEYISSDGLLDVKKLDAAIKKDIKEGGKIFMPKPDNPDDPANMPYFALGALLAESKKDPSIITNIQTAFQKMKSTGTFDLEKTLQDNTPIATIKTNMQSAKGQLKMKLEQEHKDKLKTENETKLAKLPITGKSSTGGIDTSKIDQTVLAGVLGTYTIDELTNNPIKQKECMTKITQLPGAIVVIKEDRDNPLDNVIQSITNATQGYNGFKNNPEEVATLKEQFTQTREEIYKKEGELIHIDFDTTKNKLYIESHGRRTGIIINGPNDIHLDGMNSSISTTSYSEIIHLADLHNIIVQECMGQGEIGDLTVFQAGNGNQLMFNYADGNTKGGKLVEFGLGLVRFSTNIPGVDSKMKNIPMLSGKAAMMASFLNGERYTKSPFTYTEGGAQKQLSKGLLRRNGVQTPNGLIGRKNAQGAKIEPTNNGSAITQVSDTPMVAGAVDSIKEFFGSQPELGDRNEIPPYDPKDPKGSIDTMISKLITHKRYIGYFNTLYMLQEGTGGMTFDKAKEELANMRLFPNIEYDFKDGGYIPTQLKKKGYNIASGASNDPHIIRNIDMRVMKYFEHHMQDYQPSGWAEFKHTLSETKKDTLTFFKELPKNIKEGISDLFKGGFDIGTKAFDDLIQSINKSGHSTVIRTTLATVLGLKAWKGFR